MEGEINDTNLKAIFDGVDRDGNGQIDIKELYAALKQANKNKFSPESCQLLMSLFDVNEDGRIDVREFGALLKYVRHWRDTFATYNTDMTGYIDHVQLYNTLQVMGCGLPEQACTTLISNFDCQNVSRLSFDDYIRCCVTVQMLHKSFKAKQNEKGVVRLDLEGLLTMVVESRPRPVQNLSFD